METSNRIVQDSPDMMDCREDKGGPSSGQWVNPFIWSFPEIFWDNLSKIPLDLESLREFDRLSSQQENKNIETAADIAGLLPTNAVRLARGGGPDLSHVRGIGSQSRFVPFQYAAHMKDRKWATSSSSFEQHLEDHNVHSLDTSRPPRNLAAIQAALATRRPVSEWSDGSLSENVYVQFCQTQEMPEASLELENVIYSRLDSLVNGGGKAGQYICSSVNCSFSDMRRLTDQTVPEPFAEVCDGADPEQLGAWLLGEFGDLFEPTEDAVLVPNFFYEFDRVLLPRRWMERVACYKSACGARAMHVLQYSHLFDRQDLNLNKLPLDGCAYTLSAVYHDGTLSVYAHYATAGDTLEYHMTLVGVYAVTASYEDFVVAVTALRNARDLAKQWRDVFVEAARARLTPEQVAYDEEAEAMQAETQASFRQVNRVMAAKREALGGCTSSV